MELLILVVTNIVNLIVIVNFENGFMTVMIEVNIIGNTDIRSVVMRVHCIFGNNCLWNSKYMIINVYLC